MGGYEIRLTPHFEKMLSKLPHDIRRRVLEGCEVVSNPLVGKPMKGSYEVRIDDGVFRISLRSLRVGDYRVLYWVDHLRKVVWLLFVGHRSGVYKLI